MCYAYVYQEIQIEVAIMLSLTISVLFVFSDVWLGCIHLRQILEKDLMTHYPNLLLDVPKEILHEDIYRCLHVRDRARLNMALPKTHKVPIVDKLKDRNLAVLTRLIAKKKVSKLSRHMIL